MITEIITNTVIGGVAGLVCALGGAVKDAPHEGFRPHTFLRSPIVGLFGGAIATIWTTQPIMVFVFAGYFDRFVCEGWKVLRCQVPGKHSWTRPEWPRVGAGS